MSTKATLAYSDRVHVYRDLMYGDGVVHLRVHDVADISVNTSWRDTVILSMPPEDLRELRRVLNEANLGGAEVDDVLPHTAHPTPRPKAPPMQRLLARHRRQLLDKPSAQV